MSNWDNAIEIAQNNEHGACVCRLADKIVLLVSDYGETFTVWNYRPSAKRVEKRVSAAWANKFLRHAFGVSCAAYSA